MSSRRSFNIYRPTNQVMDHLQQQKNAEILEVVRNAISRCDVKLAFQPIVQAGQPQQIAFYEGLLRVLDVDGNVIPAGRFIDAAEELELGRQLDVMALRLGLKTLLEQPQIRLSINMSARSIGYAAWLKTLHDALAQDSRVGERLIVEITESSAMLTPDRITRFMSDLHQYGVGFALDDFGAGNTSFRYLRDFQFDIIKIDGQFIQNIANNPDNQVLARALIAIAKQFEIYTVAEFVETHEDATWLAESGIDCLQGYFYGAPSLTPPWLAHEVDQTLSA